MTVQASIMKHLESSLGRPSPATHSQKRQWQRWKSSAHFSSFNSTSKASLHHSAVRSGASAQGWVGGGWGGITVARSADGFSSIIWSLLLAFKQDVLSLTEIGGWRTTFLPPLRFEAMRATFSPPWVRLGCHALSSGHKERKSKQRPVAVHFMTAG